MYYSVITVNCDKGLKKMQSIALYLLMKFFFFIQFVFHLYLDFLKVDRKLWHKLVKSAPAQVRAVMKAKKNKFIKKPHQIPSFKRIQNKKHFCLFSETFGPLRTLNNAII